MAETFEAADGSLKPLGRAESLGAASSALPAGAYTTFRTYSGKRVLRLGQHADRLNGAPGGPQHPLRLETLAAAVAAALRHAGSGESRVRLTYAPPRLFVSVEPFEALPRRLYEEGVRCRSVPLRRENPQAKDTRFLAPAAEAYRRLPEGVHEGLLVAEDGSVLEGLSSNFFGIRDGVLRTEGSRIILGVTRALVLEAAGGLLPVRTDPLKLEELGQAEECFLTSASRSILPVVEVDGRRIADGRPGRITRLLMARFDLLVEREAAPLPGA